MNVTQLSQAARASIDTLAGLNSRTLASVEQLAALNVQTVKTVQTEAAESVQAALSAKSLAELLQLQASSLQAVPQKAAAYGRHAGEILVTLAAAQRATVEAQVSSLQDRFLEGLAGAVSNVPGGDNALVVAKSAVAAVNDVYEGSLFAQRLERQPDYFDRLHEYWGSMPADRFPHVAALSEEIGGGEDEGEVRFAFALQLFITGLAAVTTTTGRP